MDVVSLCAVAGWLILHVGAIASAWGTRVMAGSRAELPIQLIFLFSMAAVSGSALYSHQLQLGLWIPSGITLTAMVLTAVTDFQPTYEPAHVMIS